MKKKKKLYNTALVDGIISFTGLNTFSTCFHSERKWRKQGEEASISLREKKAP